MSTKKGIVHTSPSVFVNPMRLRLMMLEKGISNEYDEHVINMFGKGEQKSWKYNKVNPWGETPALELPDGTYISEATAIARYLDNTHPGRKIMGETPLEQAPPLNADTRGIISFLSLRLGPALELTYNPQWGEHCRKEALAMAGQLDRYLSDGKSWLLGGKEPTFSDTTLVVAIAFSKVGIIKTDLTHRFEYLDKYWQRWQQRDSFKIAYADGGNIRDLDYLKNGTDAPSKL